MFKNKKVMAGMKLALFGGAFLIGSVVGAPVAKAQEVQPAADLKVTVALPTFGLVETEKGLHFFDPETNTVLRDSFKVFQGESYYFDEEGNAISGLFEDEESEDLYYFDEESHQAVKEAWVEEENKSYYFDQDGKAVSGLYKDEEKEALYYFDSVTKEGKKNGLVTDQGKTYYFDEDGEAISGLWKNPEDESLHYFKLDDHSQLEESWKSIGQDTYYFDQTGAAVTGLQTTITEGEVYYLFDDFKQAKNYWYFSSDEVYYFNDQGRAETGLHLDPISQKYFYFDETSHNALRNTVKDIGQDTYFFTGDGTAYTGFYYDQGNNVYYYDTATAKLLKSEWLVQDNATYYFAADGKAVKGFFDVPEKDGRYYFDPVTSQQVRDTEIEVGDYIYSVDSQGLVGPGRLTGYIWPTSTRDITSYFGGRWHPVYGSYRFHDGIDLADGYGSSIYAVSDGTVITAGYDYGLGNHVVIRHEDGSQTTYAHMSGFNTYAGAYVGQGDVIGYMGSTGTSTGTHLHFEVLSSGGYLVDPLSVLP